jgi:hypothetical protein
MRATSAYGVSLTSALLGPKSLNLAIELVTYEALVRAWCRRVVRHEQDCRQSVSPALTVADIAVLGVDSSSGPTLSGP